MAALDMLKVNCQIMINMKSTCSIPSLEELCEAAKPHATYWKEIGELLNLSPKNLRIIENDYAYKTTPCCSAMLQKWLELDSKVSWAKWYEVLTSIENSGMRARTYVCFKCILGRYVTGSWKTCIVHTLDLVHPKI